MIYYFITLSKKYKQGGRSWMDVIVEIVKNGSTIGTNCYRSSYQTIYKYKSDFIKDCYFDDIDDIKNDIIWELEQQIKEEQEGDE